MSMYFNSYDEAHSVALKQSRGKLADAKLYIKYIPHTGEYRIGFTPDNTENGYVYNGEYFSYEAEN